ncbi:glycosyltransferase family 4 protein [Iningainema tapete]|uniref:Glycosyltransferase family 4 protein n=1 Tax=Iningainema tapete BLCC-T55 TaxID=2748662 RepID=A0A8J6XMI8_9CYAN|nr:glycosyltransferase family 1 protein [Iningainema tapete]MBD2775932.1 glycosyltransferase family 4 protein [Iningainema tapete BLCC-T55]
MRVGIFAGTQIPELGGGYTFESQVLATLLKFAPQSHHKFVLYTFSQDIPEDLSYSHVQIISLARCFKQRTFQERLISKIRRTASAISRKRHSNKFKMDVAAKFVLDYLIQNNTDITLSLSPYCLTMELPYITVVWDLQHRLQPYFPEVSTAGEWENREQSYTMMLKRASFIITGTQTGKEEIERFYQVPSARIKVLPLPTPQFAFNSAQCDEKRVLEKYSLPENYLFYPAQFWSHKNHIGLLLASKWLRDKYNLVFPVVFSGSDKGNQIYIKQRVAELDLTEQVYFLGFVPQEDLIPLYRNAFALVFLSFFGPDNLPPLEAFAIGCPVVASNVSGAQEQLGDAALLVDPKNTEQIALAIKSLWDDKTLRQNLIQRGLVRATKWTTQDYVKGIFSILDEFEAIRRCWL